MKTYTIELTGREIEVMQIALCAAQLEIERQVEHLECNNETGINTRKIEKKRERMKELDELWNKLYETENK